MEGGATVLHYVRVGGGIGQGCCTLSGVGWVSRRVGGGFAWASLRHLDSARVVCNSVVPVVVTIDLHVKGSDLPHAAGSLLVVGGNSPIGRW